MNQIILHHIDLVGNGKVFPAPADDENRGDVFRPIQFAHSVGKGCDRLFFDQRFHHAVADHKVRGASVLVNQKQLRAHMDGFHDIRRLRGRARGVFGRKIACITVRKPLDKRRDIDVLYAPAVLSGYGNGACIGDTKLSAIPLYVIVNSSRDRIEQSRFSRITATRNDSNALSDSHSAYTENLNFIIRRGLKRYRIRHGKIRPLGARQNASVGNKGTIVTLLQPRANGCLLFCKRGGALQPFLIKIQNKSVYCIGKVTAKHLHRLAKLPFRQLHLNEKAKTHKGRSGNTVTKQIDLRARTVLIILLRKERKICRVPADDLPTRSAHVIFSVFAVGAASVIQNIVQLIHVRLERAQTEIRRRALRFPARHTDAKRCARNTDQNRRLVLCQFMRDGYSKANTLSVIDCAIVHVRQYRRMCGIADEHTALIHLSVGRRVGFHRKQFIF